MVSTRFLMISILFIGLSIFMVAFLYLPYLTNVFVEIDPSYAYLQLPGLIGIYLTLIPFCYALYQSFLLLRYIEQRNVFSLHSAKALKSIRSCAFVIAGFYIVGCIFFFTQNALHPSLLLISVAIIFVCFVISVFSGLLQALLTSAVEIKEENELTV
ncbi:DUF2975 domain-containing protein [Geomicrobium sp. JCM 19039]|uniref:DUF2975 domain-containing protein n=1 Tax=Geomicrobium sp. JCM 19039 TaxID=1460636 RepID=UPI00045F344D|nr:DUF2975 domain-containing protein [Geomicrobium sp. JCM 19039]GAK12447.1 putative membrane protein [Geomicrobium sp. JCM 19039]